MNIVFTTFAASLSKNALYIAGYDFNDLFLVEKVHLRFRGMHVDVHYAGWKNKTTRRMRNVRV